MLLACAGGFLDAYTYVSRDHVFANSQTGNLVLFGVGVASGAWREALRHVWPILAFVLGVLCAELLQAPRVARVILRPARASIALEILVLAIVGALPAAAPDLVVTVLVSFVSSVQVSTFRTLVKWPYSTTMTTGNLRTATQAHARFLLHRAPEAAAQARAFGVVIAAFLSGAVLGSVVTGRLGGHAAWVVAGILCLTPVLFVLDERG